MRYFEVLEAPFGVVTPVVEENGRIAQLWTSDASGKITGAIRDRGRLSAAREQLMLYFDRKLTSFSLPLALDGSPFQMQVWKLLLEIPYGQTRTYGDLAHKLGLPDAARAVGRANATNPIAIVVPCHRVIGASGDLTGYAGGIDVKRKLLEIESGDLGGLFD
ncbi:MAG TPA: methylated-DNA--[protein]-cysteine S-methyltransferase [Fimbriimonas sp.]|nr:methylated-DNA--[protein]-cysteine S-methyltransferase [Fimbriimonas sp.]